MIKQNVYFNAPPEIIYDILIDEKKHSEVIGAKAKIENKVGGKFSVWDGYAEGVNLELSQGKKIVQTWWANDWPKGNVSKVTFNLKDKGKGTELKFVHEDVPEKFEREIEKGWKEYYWEPLREYLKLR